MNTSSSPQSALCLLRAGGSVIPIKQIITKLISILIGNSEILKLFDSYV